MNSFIRFPSLLLACLASGAALSGPGAHGPGGEHLDGPSPVLSAGGSVPRVEAKSELFELVARIEGDTFSILVDRYDTNEPVLEGSVEVESGSLRQRAVFRRAQGDYAITEPRFIRALSAPGSHAIVFTVSAGKDSDLLEGAMRIASAGHDDHGGWRAALSRPALWAAALGILAVPLGFVAWRKRRASR